jgi:hypothetical protein
MYVIIIIIKKEKESKAMNGGIQKHVYGIRKALISWTFFFF